MDDNGRLCYEPGKIPAVGKSYNWWEKNAKNFCPECGSRLGTNLEYVEFLAVIIKELVASGKSAKWAWDAVCNNSKELGHYWNSKEARHDFENTGNRAICGWCDLGNTCKILAANEETCGFWIAGGYYFCKSNGYPLADWYHYPNQNNDYDNGDSCGWIVFDRCPDC